MYVLFVCTINSFFFRFRCPSSSALRLPRCNCHWIRPLHAFLKLGQSSSTHPLFPSLELRLWLVWNSVFVQFQLEIHDSRFACIYFDCIRRRAGCINVGAALMLQLLMLQRAGTSFRLSLCLCLWQKQSNEHQSCYIEMRVQHSAHSRA